MNEPSGEWTMGNDEPTATTSELPDALTDNRVFRSVVRHGFPSTNRNRALTVFTNFFLHIHPVKVREKAIAFRRTYYLGGLTAVTFLILTVTGLLLMFYYRPSVPAAYQDMKDLEFVVTAGVFLRNLHRWSAHAMVALVFLHMIRVFFAGAYKPPREFNWVIGVVLFVTTILLSYTGYLLPWDQLALWGVTVGTNMARAVPALGEEISFLLLGANQVDANTLVRFYVLHCCVLPAATILLIAVHIWRVRKDGGIYIPPEEREDASAEDGEDDTRPVELPLEEPSEEPSAATVDEEVADEPSRDTPIGATAEDDDEAPDDDDDDEDDDREEEEEEKP